MATMIATAVLSSTATAAQVTALASTITTGLTIAGTAFSTVTSIAQGNQQAAMIEAQARNDASNATLKASLLAAQTAEENLQDMKKLKSILATQEATGRSSVIIEDSLAEAAKTFDIRRFSSETQQEQLRRQAQFDLDVGSQEASAAKTGGLIDAGGSLFDFAIRTSERGV
jgi:F0F1-type ATP synthase membrane subunit c/vacuolar-type H+-ATPase subunit K